MGATFDRIADADLPLYVTEPVPSSRRTGSRPVAWRQALSAMRSSPGPLSTPGAGMAHSGGATSPCFSRFIELPGDQLPTVLLEWWARAASSGRAAIGDRLLVTAPHDEGGTWTISGRLSRRAGRRALPVAVDLSAHNRLLTRMTMMPRARVATTQRYFRVGNSVLDRLVLELADCHRRLA